MIANTMFPERMQLPSCATAMLVQKGARLARRGTFTACAHIAQKVVAMWRDPRIFQKWT
jgi:methyl coenzyme M reductase subunit C